MYNGKRSEVDYSICVGCSYLRRMNEHKICLSDRAYVESSRVFYSLWVCIEDVGCRKVVLKWEKRLK